MSALVPGARLWPYPGWLMLGAVVITVSLLVDSIAEARAHGTSRSVSATGQTLHRHP